MTKKKKKKKIENIEKRISDRLVSTNVWNISNSDRFLSLISFDKLLCIYKFF